MGEQLKLLEDNMTFAVFGFVRECEGMIPYYIPELIRWLILHYYHFIGNEIFEDEECLYWKDLKKKKMVPRKKRLSRKKKKKKKKKRSITLNSEHSTEDSISFKP